MACPLILSTSLISLHHPSPPPSSSAIIPAVETKGGLANISSVMNTDWPVVFTVSIFVTPSSFGSHWLGEQIVIICKCKWMPQACTLQANQNLKVLLFSFIKSTQCFSYILQLHIHMLELQTPLVPFKNVTNYCNSEDLEACSCVFLVQRRRQQSQYLLFNVQSPVKTLESLVNKSTYNVLIKIFTFESSQSGFTAKNNTISPVTLVVN